MRWRAALVCVFVLIAAPSFLALVGAAQARVPMPSLDGYTHGANFMNPCATEDPFYLVTEAYERVQENEWWDAFKVFLVPTPGTRDRNPFLILLTDGKDLVTREYIDRDRDGYVDSQAPLRIERGAFRNYQCEIARRLQ